MSFGVCVPKTPFRYIGQSHNRPCGFCGTTKSVKYAYEVEDSSCYSEEARISETTISCCNSCVLKQMWTFSNK